MALMNVLQCCIAVHGSDPWCIPNVQINTGSVPAVRSEGTTKNDPAVQSAYNSGGGGGGQSLFNLISDFATTMNGTP